MQQIFLAMVLLHPCEYRRESRWMGCECLHFANVRGDGVSVVVWQGGSVVLEYAKWGRTLIVKKVW